MCFHSSYFKFSRNISSTGKISGYKQTTNELWEFEPVSNTWSKKSDFPGSKREGAFGFSINEKGYIGGGDDIFTWKKDVWEYDPATDSWAQKANYGGGETTIAAGFVVNGKAYIGTGRAENLAFKNDFWEYDPALNLWIQKSNFPGEPRGGCIGFCIDQFGFLGTGYTFSGSQKWLNDFWSYDPVSDTWIQKAHYKGQGYVSAVGFSIEMKGYVGTGSDSVVSHKDFWEYSPDTATAIEEIYNDAGFSVYPNPFSATAVISFSMDLRCHVSAAIFDSGGNMLHTFF